jgi:hypothetical protein
MNEKYIGPVLDKYDLRVRKVFVYESDGEGFLVQRDYFTEEDYSRPSPLGEVSEDIPLIESARAFSPPPDVRRAVERAELALDILDASSPDMAYHFFRIADTLREEPNGELAMKIDNQELTLNDLGGILKTYEPKL